ncbi:MAG: hypothetical protein ACD_46C00202G0001 [uncultured bacterium]|nr:MAG: hypothetical protein ACD_46C00202G0001 [uncultured bacterium]
MMPISALLDNYNQHYQNGILDLSNKDIHAEDMQILGEFLKKHPEIKRLNLSNNDIYLPSLKKGQLQPLAKLAKIQTITHLDISNCNIENEDIAIACLDNKSIRYLNISGNRISKLSVYTLAQSETITHLDISNNDTLDNDAGIEEFILNKNQKIISLNINGCNVSQDLQKQLNDLIKTNKEPFIKKEMKKLKCYSRLYGQVLRGIKKSSYDVDRARFVAHKIFKLSANPTFFGDSEIEQSNKMDQIMQDFSDKPKIQN